MDLIERACDEALDLASAAYDDGQELVAGLACGAEEEELTPLYMAMRERQTALAAFQVTVCIFRSWRDREIELLEENARLRAQLAGSRLEGARRLRAVG